MAEPLAIFWDEGVGGNMEHLAEHGVSMEEAEQVIAAYFDKRQRSRTTPAYELVQGFTQMRRFLVVVFEYIADDDVIIPVTAFEPEGA